MLDWYPSGRLITHIGHAVVDMWPPEQIIARHNNLTYAVTFPGGRFELERDTPRAGTRNYLSVKIIVPNNIGNYYASADKFFDVSPDGLHRTCFTQTITRKEDELEFTSAILALISLAHTPPDQREP